MFLLMINYLLSAIYLEGESLAKASKKEKKLLAVDGEVAQKIIQIANRKGMTVYSFTNEILQQAIKAENMNRSLEDIVERYRLFEANQDGGALFIPSGTLFFMVQQLYQQEKEKLLNKWYESGRWYGKYLLMKFNREDPLGIFRKILEACTNKSSQIRILREENKLSLNWLSPSDPLEYTELFSKFLEGALHSLGYETVKNDVSKGLITLELEHKGEVGN